LDAMKGIEKSARANPLTIALSEIDTDNHDKVPIGNGRTKLLVDDERVEIAYIDQDMAYVSLPSTGSDNIDMRVQREMIERAIAQVEGVRIIHDIPEAQ